MITPGGNRYEVVLVNKWYLRELVGSIRIQDSLMEISQRADVDLMITEDFPGIEPSQEIRISGIPFGGSSMVYLLHPGVVWECDSEKTGSKHLAGTIFDRTIYLSESEDEFYFPAGQTADQRIRFYAEKWGIPISGNFPSTEIQLSGGIKRAASIYQHIMNDLKETVKKGGKMYRPRMTPDGLELYEIGSNSVVWVLEEGSNAGAIGQNRTMDGVVTKVKVLGNAEDDDQLSPVLAIVEGDTQKLGTIQKIITDQDIKTADHAQKAGQDMLSGVVETFRFSGIDINTIRAGDKVHMNGMDLIARSVIHDLGDPGSMSLELARLDRIRREIYLE